MLTYYSCVNGGDITGPAVKGNEIRCKCYKKSGKCVWATRNGKTEITTRSMKCSGGVDLSRRITPCNEKPTFCKPVKVFEIDTKNSVTITDSWECQKCFLLNVDLETMSEFDQQDFIDIDLTDSIKEITGWSYPVNSVEMVSSSGKSERWRVGFDRRAHLKNTKVTFSIKIKMKKKEPVIQSISICPCGQFNNILYSNSEVVTEN